MLINTHEDCGRILARGRIPVREQVHGCGGRARGRVRERARGRVRERARGRVREHVREHENYYGGSIHGL